MGLKLKLKPGERLIVNGCIIRNGERRLEIEIENRADVLRAGEMLDEAGARTPVSRLIYLIQVVLVSKDHRSQVVPEIMQRIEELSEVMRRSHSDTLAEVRELVADGQFYAACRRLIPVLRHEERLLQIAKG